MKNCTPKPGIQGQEPINMPQTSIFIVGPLACLQRKFIVYKSEKGHPTMEMHYKIEGRKNHGSRILRKG